jgi:hypothetical protein
MNGHGQFLLRMLLFVLAVGAICIVVSPALQSAFMANPVLNGLIIGVLVLGILYNFRQVLALRTEHRWIEGFQRDRAGESTAQPRLLAPLANMLRTSDRQVTLSATTMRAVLDGISLRLDESREQSRYMISLLIFLGLLGTFWGLLQTIGAVGDTISGLEVGTAGTIADVFNNLKRGLQEPLSGMGTAFSSSLFGLAGSLVLGFLDLQAGHAQNRFYNGLEEWLSSLTLISSGTLLVADDEDSDAYSRALLEQTARGLAALQETLNRAEESQVAANSSVVLLAHRLDKLNEHLKAQQASRVEEPDIGFALASLNEEIRQLRETLVALAEENAPASSSAPSRGPDAPDGNG